MTETNFYRGYSLTKKQRETLKVIIVGNGFDKNKEFIPVDMDELLERIPYQTTKASMQFSIRALIKREFIVKGVANRREKNRVTFVPLPLALHVISLDENSEPLPQHLLESEDRL